ncbi:ABC transporter ATP-binding protein [Amycolatopsis sp. FDAARGOS 1241]|uniref:ABC transporter ATP-binding protein n=1 Tax=Amycolatopsis sp. FDAARGOS 1241 TaxID=2778070 RepID=UPI0019506623|nr:ABC transporter ATP-binding protein [Amycolatopsis sp. FDAARGOS 1241]QRP46154.1 ABC transporter ATP-binding protein [Amycolatopsis sp. FDAARGOS 1241]
MIDARGLGVKAGDLWLLDDLDFSVDPGECAVLVGPNGVGKSTLLRCLYGMQEPQRGRVRIDGDKPDERSVAFRRKVSVLFDDSDFFAELTPLQHLELLAGSFDEDLGDFEQLLADAGLADRARVTAGHFSAGQRRRLLLLGVTARPHKVLLLDEPERALDTAGKDWLVDLIARSTSAGAAVVVATHHPPLLDAADSVLELW